MRYLKVFDDLKSAIGKECPVPNVSVVNGIEDRCSISGSEIDPATVDIAYTSDNTFILGNSTRIVSTYTTTQANESVKVANDVSYIEYMYVNNNDITPQTAITFSTPGEHTVMFKFNSRNEIPTGLFSGCTKMTKIFVPKGITSISGGIFAGCDNLSKIEVSSNNSNYTSYGNGIVTNSDSGHELIAGCKDTTVPYGVYSIRSGAFSGIKTIKSISFPDDLRTVGDSSFATCTALSSVTFGNCTTEQTIGSSSFVNCTNLKTITFNSGHDVSIGGNAFSGCPLESITFIGSGVTITNVAFSGISSNCKLYVPSNSNLLNDETTLSNNFEGATLYAGGTLVGKITKSTSGSSYYYSSSSTFSGITGVGTYTLKSLGSTVTYNSTEYYESETIKLLSVQELSFTYTDADSTSYCSLEISGNGSTWAKIDTTVTSNKIVYDNYADKYVRVIVNKTMVPTISSGDEIGTLVITTF